MRFPSIETVELQTTQGSHFAAHSHCRSERCERRDEAWWRIRRGASYWRPAHQVEIMRSFLFVSGERLEPNETENALKCE